MIQQIKPLKPYVMQIQPLQPLGVRKRSSFQKAPNYYSDITDPFAVDSTVDVLFNRRGKEKLIQKELGWDLGDLPVISDLAETVVSGVLYLNNSYVRPALKGEVGALVVNSLVDFTQTMDLAANSAKALALGDDGGKTSIAVGAGMGALTAALGVATGGTSLGAGIMAGFIASGLSSIASGIIQNPELAFDRFEKSTGFSEHGRTQYDFDTGNFIANMYGEMTLDPLNWGSYGQSFLVKQGIKKGWKVPAKAFSALTILSDANDLITTAAWTLNPLGATLKGAKKGFTSVMRYKAKAAMLEASKIVDRGIKSMDDINKVQASLVHAANEADEMRRGYAATGELSRIRGDSRQVSVSIANVANTLTEAGLPEAQVPAVIKHIFTSYLYGDLTSLVQLNGVWQYSKRALANVLGESVPSNVDVAPEALDALFKSLKADFGSYSDALVNNSSPILQAIETYADVAIRSSDFAHRALSGVDGVFKYYSSKLSEILAKPASWMGFNGNIKNTKAQALQYLLLKELPDIAAFIKVDSITKVQTLDYASFIAKYDNTPALQVFESLAKSQGITLEQVFQFNGKVFDFAKTVEQALAEYNDSGVQQVTLDILGLAKNMVDATDPKVVTNNAGSILGTVFGKIAGINKFYDAQRSLKGPLNDSLKSFSKELGGQLKNLFIDIGDKLYSQMTSGTSAPIARWAKTLQTEHVSVLRFVDTLREALDGEGTTLAKSLFSGYEDPLLASIIKSTFYPTLMPLGDKTFKKFYNTVLSMVRFIEAFSHFKKGEGFKDLAGYNFDMFVTDMLAVNTAGELGDILKYLDALPRTETTDGIMQFLKELELVKPKFGIEEEVAAAVGVQENAYVMKLSKQMMTMQHFLNISEDKALMSHIEDLLDPENPLKHLLDEIANYPDNPYFDRIRALSREILGSVEGYRNYSTLLKRLGDTLDGTVKFNPNADELSRMVDPASIKVGANGMMEIDPSQVTGEFVVDLAALPYYKSEITSDMLRLDGTLDVTKYLHSTRQVNFLRGVYHGMFEDVEVQSYIPLSKRLQTIAIDVQLGKTLEVESDLANLKKTIEEAKDILIKEQKQTAEEIAAKVEVAKFEQLAMDLDVTEVSEATKLVERVLSIPSVDLLETTGKTHLEVLDDLLNVITEAKKQIDDLKPLVKKSLEASEDLTALTKNVENLENLKHLWENAETIVKEYEVYFTDGFHMNVSNKPLMLEHFVRSVDPMLRNGLLDIDVFRSNPSSYLRNFKFDVNAKPIIVNGPNGKVQFRQVSHYANYHLAKDLNLDPLAHKNKGFKVPTLESLGIPEDQIGPKDKAIFAKNIQLEEDEKTLAALTREFLTAEMVTSDRRAYIKGEMGRLKTSIYKTKKELERAGFGTYNQNKHVIKARLEMYQRVAMQEYFVANPQLIDHLLAQAPGSLKSPVMEEMRMKLVTLFPTRELDFQSTVPVRSHLVWDSEAINRLHIDTGYKVTSEEMALFVKSISEHNGNRAITKLDMVFDGALKKDDNTLFKFLRVNSPISTAFSEDLNVRLIGPDGRIFAGPTAFDDYRNFVRKVRQDLGSKYQGDIDRLPEGQVYITYKRRTSMESEKAITDLHHRFVAMPFTPTEWTKLPQGQIQSLLLNSGDRFIRVGTAAPGQSNSLLLTNLIAQANASPARLIYVGGDPNEIKAMLSEHWKTKVSGAEDAVNKATKEASKNKIPENLIFPKEAFPDRKYKIETLDQFKDRIKKDLGNKYSIQTKIDPKTGETNLQVVTHQLNQKTGEPELTRYGRLKDKLDKTTVKYKELEEIESNVDEFGTRNIFTTRYDVGNDPGYDTRFTKVVKGFDNYFQNKDNRFGPKHMSFKEGGAAFNIHAQLHKRLDNLLVKFDDDRFWNEAVLARRAYNLESQRPQAPNKIEYLKYETEEEAIAYYMSEDYAAIEVQDTINEVLRQYKEDPETWLEGQTLNKVSQKFIDDHINTLEPVLLTKKEAASVYKKTVREYNKALKEFEVASKKFDKLSESAKRDSFVKSKFQDVKLTPDEEAFVAEQKVIVNGIKAKNNLYKQALDAYELRVKELGTPDLSDAELKSHVKNIKTYFKDMNYEVAKIKSPGRVGGSDALQNARRAMYKARNNLDDFYENIRKEPLLLRQPLEFDDGAEVSRYFDASKKYTTIEEMYDESFKANLAKATQANDANRYRNTFENNIDRFGNKQELPETPVDLKPLPRKGDFKVISGGQSGGDIGGLLSAQRAGIKTGGTAPPGFESYIKNPELLKSLGLVDDGDPSEAYTKALVTRSMKNVDSADGTIGFMPEVQSVGTAKTLGYAQTGRWGYMDPTYKGKTNKPHLAIDWSKPEDEAVEDIVKFIQQHDIKTLNVAGSREHVAPGIQARTEAILDKVFSRLEEGSSEVVETAPKALVEVPDAPKMDWYYKPNPEGKRVNLNSSIGFIPSSPPGIKKNDYISEFTGRYSFLSNFHKGSPIEFNGVYYPTSEHAYQAAKAANEEDFQYILTAPTPAEAKSRGNVIQPRADWDNIKDQVMYDVLKQKFENPTLKAKLLATGRSTLTEGNWWGDNYWGYDLKLKQGENRLGMVLELIREELTERPGSKILDIPYTQKTILPPFMNPQDFEEPLGMMKLSDIYTTAKDLVSEKVDTFRGATGGLEETSPEARFKKLTDVKKASVLAKDFGRVADHPLESVPDPIKGYPLQKIAVEERQEVFDMMSKNPDHVTSIMAERGLTAEQLESELMKIAAESSAVGKQSLLKFGRLKTTIENMKPSILKDGVSLAYPEPVFTTFGAKVSGDVLDRFHNIDQLLKKILQRDQTVLFQNMSPDYAGFLVDPSDYVDQGRFLANSVFLDHERVFIYYLDPAHPDYVEATSKGFKDTLSAPKYNENAAAIQRYLTDNHQGLTVNLFYNSEYELLLLWLQRALEKSGG